MVTYDHLIIHSREQRLGFGLAGSLQRKERGERAIEKIGSSKSNPICEECLDCDTGWCKEEERDNRIQFYFS